MVTDNKTSRNEQLEALLDQALDNFFQTHDLTSLRNKKEIHGHGHRGHLTKLTEFRHIPASHSHRHQHGPVAGEKHLEETLADLITQLTHPHASEPPLPQPLLSLLKLEPETEVPKTKLLYSGPVEVPLDAGHEGHVGEHVDAVGAPVVTTEELPAPPGCHSIQTTTCHKVPHKNSTKIPYEICSSIKCDMVLSIKSCL